MNLPYFICKFWRVCTFFWRQRYNSQRCSKGSVTLENPRTLHEDKFSSTTWNPAAPSSGLHSAQARPPRSPPKRDLQQGSLRCRRRAREPLPARSRRGGADGRGGAGQGGAWRPGCARPWGGIEGGRSGPRVLVTAPLSGVL